MKNRLNSICKQVSLLFIPILFYISSTAQSSIFGRVWSPINTPVAGAYVFVTNAELNKLYGEAVTLSEKKGDLQVGSYRIDNLPLNVKLYVYTFSDKIPSMNGYKEVTLRTNQTQKVVLDISFAYQDPGMIKNPLLRIPTLLKQAALTDAANSLIERLKTLKNEDSSPKAKGMTVSLTSTAILPQGSAKSFVHSIILSGLPDMNNQEIFIDDPVSQKTTIIRTNAYGIATYSCSPDQAINPGLYAIVFSYGNQKIFSTVVVSPSGNLPVTVLKSFQLPVGVVDQTDPNFSILPGTYRMKDYSTPLSRSFNAAVDFGLAVAIDYIKNPGNDFLVVVTAITCSAGQAAPVAGQVICAAGIKAIETGVAVTAAKVAANKLIDGSKGMTDTQKANWKEAVALGVCAISLAEFNPGSGLVDVTILRKSWSVGTTVYKVLSLESDKEALSIAGQVNGSNEIVQMTMVRNIGGGGGGAGTTKNVEIKIFNPDQSTRWDYANKALNVQWDATKTSRNLPMKLILEGQNYLSEMIVPNTGIADWFLSSTKLIDGKYRIIIRPLFISGTNEQVEGFSEYFDIYNTNYKQQPVKPVRNSILGRNVNYVREIFVNNKDIKIQVWDHGQIDGDIISVYLNGLEIIRKFTLGRNYYQIDCTLDENFPNDLILFAHNVGTLPPNTAAIRIIDGDNNEELILNATLGTSEALVINVKN